jgi:TolB protein
VFRRICLTIVIAILSTVIVDTHAQSIVSSGLIAFNRIDGSVYLVDANGNNARLLIKQCLASSRPAWSPDGTRIAFSTGQCWGQPTGTCILTLATNQINILDFGEEFDSYPAYSPDGKYLAFTANSELYIADALDGRHRHQLTYNSPFSSVKPSWSPDSKHIVFEIDINFVPQIDIIDVDGKNQHRIISSGHAPAWSPDGNSIAYGVGYNVRSELYISDTKGKNTRQLTHSIDGSSADSPTWSPDSTQIAYAARLKDVRNFAICVIDADGSNQRVISPEPYFDDNPAWSPANVSLPPDKPSS